MIRAVSILLILWGCAFAQAPIDIVSSTPLGMPCGGISTLGCMPDAQCGWMVVVRTGDAAAFAGKLTYTDADGKQQTAIVTATATGEYTALAFRVGVFRAGGNRFVSLDISSLQPVATVRQDSAGTIITIGETTWGPPRQAIWTDSGINGPAPETLSDLARSLATQPMMVGESLSCNLCATTVRLAGESLRVTPRVVGLTTIITKGDPAQATTNLKEYHQ